MRREQRGGTTMAVQHTRSRAAARANYEILMHHVIAWGRKSSEYTRSTLHGGAIASIYTSVVAGDHWLDIFSSTAFTYCMSRTEQTVLVGVTRCSRMYSPLSMSEPSTAWQ